MHTCERDGPPVLVLTTRCACGPEFISLLAFKTDFTRPLPLLHRQLPSPPHSDLAAARGQRGKDVTRMSEHTPVDRNRLCRGSRHRFFSVGEVDTSTCGWGMQQVPTYIHTYLEGFSRALGMGSGHSRSFLHTGPQ